MSDKLPPERTLQRKLREAEALKANMKRRKEQAQKQAAPDAAMQPANEDKNG